MSWKTSPIANRFKQTVGWKFISPSLNTQNQLRLTNIKSFKNFSFITHWLKYKRWYLLNFHQIRVNGLEIYNIIALRMPRVRLRRKSGITKIRLCKLKMNSPERVINYDYLKGKLNITRSQYTRRKKLFSAHKTLKLDITRRYLTQQKHLRQTRGFRQMLVEANLRKIWLKIFIKLHDYKYTRAFL